MAEFIFLKSLHAKGRARVQALPGQTLRDGQPVNDHWFVSCELTIRSLYPIGTHFGCLGLKGMSGYYTAGQLFPLGVSEYEQPSHQPPVEMIDAYKEFLGAETVVTPTELTAEEETRTRTFLSILKGNDKFKVPNPVDDGFYVDEDAWFLLVRNIKQQANTMLVGPTGTGKTELVQLLAKRMEVPCSIYDMGSMHDPIAGLLGVHRLERGVSIFDYAKFTKDITRKGIVLLDELSRAPVTTNNIMFPCLDSRRKLPVEIAGGHDMREIPVDEDCSFVATANIGAEYTGTMSIDKALANRFQVIELGYMPEAIEVEVLSRREGIAKRDAKTIVVVANKIRNQAVAQEISSSVSTRETLMVASLIKDGWPVIKAMELCFLPIFEGTKEEGERSIIHKMLMAR